ncbi:hypothetical protein pb186bvf_020085 [Paramecium bursaria]
MEMYPLEYDFQDSDQIFNSIVFPFRQSSFIQSEYEIQQPIQFLENDSTFKIVDQKKSQRNEKPQKIQPIETKKIKKIKPQKRDYKKNICRNLLRHAIKSMINCNLCSSYLEELVDDVQYFKQYYNKILESITGFRVLREQLISTNDKEIDQNRKRAFKQYLIWYLETRATQIILQGETKYPTEYIKYKNEVLLYYVQEPEKWNSNNPEWKGGTFDQRCIYTDESVYI